MSMSPTEALGTFALKAIWLAVVLGTAIVVTRLISHKDDTDPPSGRSGLILFTDNLTGCQYLSRPIFGGPTPRLDGAGRHVGCKR
jgi:hypothetical protein